VVTHAKPPGISALALLSAALVMVLVLAGGAEVGNGPSRDLAAGMLDLSFFSPMPDDAQVGLERTVLQVSARRAGVSSAAAAVMNGRLLAPVAGTATLLLVAGGLYSFLHPNRPSPRGPPPG
jgi:hypothetical protein